MPLIKNSQFAPNPSPVEVVYLISAQTDGDGTNGKEVPALHWKDPSLVSGQRIFYWTKGTEFIALGQ